MKRIKRQFLLQFCFVLLISNLFAVYAQETDARSKALYKTETDIFYYDTNLVAIDDYIRERCRLDLYYPENQKNFATVVWFHAGGLRAGEKFIPEQLKKQNIAVAAVNYRLYPKVKSPAYIEDAAAAVVWVFKNIKKYDGNPNLIFVAGHSAGGYLTSMIGLDKKWLARFDIDADAIAGLIPFSGHAITHFTVREERGIPGEQAIIDEYAPLYYVRADAPGLVLVTGDRELELLGRYEENAYFMRMMKVAVHKKTYLYELQGFNHGEMAAPAFTILLKHLKNLINQKSADKN